MYNSNEYSKPTVSSAGCTYSRLGSLSDGPRMLSGTLSDQGQYIVPKYCPDGAGPNYPPKYDTLTHGQKYACGGYFSMSGAYPYGDCEGCKTEYVKRPCNGRIDCCGKKVEEKAVEESFRRGRGRRLR
jgi:hypothetical protein